jgi:hypothetical protein
MLPCKDATTKITVQHAIRPARMFGRAGDRALGSVPERDWSGEISRGRKRDCSLACGKAPVLGRPLTHHRRDYRFLQRPPLGHGSR